MIIESKRLILRSWEDKDANDIVEGLNNNKSVMLGKYGIN